jgi:cytochrome P450
LVPEFRRDPFGLLRRLGEQYGDVYRLPLPLYDVVIVNHPDHVGQIMNCRDGEYSMIGPLSWTTRILGASIPMMEGEKFRQRRKLLTPMFGRRHLSQIAEVIVEEFATRLAAWERFADTGETVDLQHEISRLTMPAFMCAMFSTPLTDAEITQFDQDLRLLMKSAASAVYLSPLPRLLPGRDNPLQAMARMRRWVAQRIDERLADPTPQPDLLQVMLDARYENGTPISRRDLIMEMIILMGGGYETVVASLSWTLALLGQNPAAQQQLFAEVDELGGTRPTYDDLSRLTWARACFDEGQRLQGHPFHPRFAMIDDTIGGFRIRRGSVVAVSMYALQRDSRWWGPEPDRYDPNHFTDPAQIAARPNLAFIPFGAGPHRCIGAAMAYMNAQFLLALMHQRFRLHTPPGWTPMHASTFSCTIDGGLPLTLTRVSADTPAPTQR